MNWMVRTAGIGLCAWLAWVSYRGEVKGHDIVCALAIGMLCLFVYVAGVCDAVCTRLNARNEADIEAQR